MDLQYRDIVEILRILDETPHRELRMRVRDLDVHIIKRGVANRSVQHDESAISGSGSQSGPAVPASSDETLHAQAVPNASPVRAPIVGTFYRAPSPGAPPFIEVGSRVERGDPLCIIEIMKLMNTVTATMSGEIARIDRANATAVRLGDVLMWIRTPELG